MLAAACAAALILVAPASASARPGVLRAHSFVWPASGAITRPFGYDDMGFHPGIDIGTLRSLDVRAAAPGVVTAVGYTTGFEGYGNIVLVEIGSGLQTLYAHLSQPRATIGEHVVAGQLLGIAGCTGFCTGTHLHFEVRLHGTPVNPLRFLPGGIPAAPLGPAAARRLEVARAARTILAHFSGFRLVAWLGPEHVSELSQPPARVLAGAARSFR